MGIKTYDEYLSRLKKMKRNLYIDGSKCDRLDERLAGQLRVTKETYDRANDLEWDGLATATSHVCNYDSVHNTNRWIMDVILFLRLDHRQW